MNYRLTELKVLLFLLLLSAVSCQRPMYDEMCIRDRVIDNEFYTAKFEKATVGDYSGKWTLKLTKKSTEVVLKDDVKTLSLIHI